jgi:threonylcarbamoyladenosine tRNA methylthiotransferase MtaB
MSFSKTSNAAVDVVSFGCRLNAHESEIVACEAARAGVSEVVVVNTCAVTNEAVAQARQTIRRLRREKPERRIVVTGCAAQTQPRMFAEMDEVDRVIGNDDKLRSESWRAARLALGGGHAATDKIAVSDIMAVASLPAAAVSAPARPRAYVQIQNGCDHRCTFCIIPFGRGNARSVAADRR